MATKDMDKERQPKNLYETIVDKKMEKLIINPKTGKPLKAIVRAWRERNLMAQASCLSGFEAVPTWRQSSQMLRKYLPEAR